MTRIQDTVEAVAAAIIEQKDYLTALDAEIGDGDHGLNMARGFEAVREAMDELGDESRPGPVFEAIGNALLETVGGAAGPLYATGFLKAAAVCDDDTNFSIANVEKTLGAAIKGIQARGRAVHGEKTMLDVLIPIHACFTPENAGDKTLFQCLAAASLVARDGVAYTKTIPATKGRASYVGERSIGHEDPGAVSSMIMFRAMYSYLKK